MHPARADFTFGPPAPLDPPINLGPPFADFEGEWHSCISRDELSLYFASDRAGGSGNTDLWVTTRPTKDEPWGPPANLGNQVNRPADDHGPDLSGDELALYFYSYRSGSGDLFYTSRDSKSAPWQGVRALGAVNTGSSERDPSISADGLTLYYSTNRDGNFAIWQVTRDSVSDDWRGPGEPVAAANSPRHDRYPDISRDGLSLYFSSERDGGYGAMDVYVVTRPSVDSPWGQPMNLGDAVNAPYYERGPCISADGLSLYLDAGAALHVATRPTLSDPFGVPVPISSDESSVQLSADALTMHFVSNRAGSLGYYDIWVAYRDSHDAPWHDPVNLGPGVNSSDWDWAPSISADGLELYFSSDRERGRDDTDIWVCTRTTTDEPWGPPTRLGPAVNSDAFEYHPTISGDRLTLIFSSTRAGGEGEADLYASQRATVSEPWGAAKNLGENVNSSYNDYWPSVSSNGRWLFYGSNRPETPTYKDILLSRRRPDGSWGPARNLALEIDLPDNAGGPTVSADAGTLHFWSYSAGGQGGSDLWKIDLVPLVDLNGDGRIDGGDLGAVVNHWGQDEPACDIGPSAMGDGIVDVEDLLVVAEHLAEDMEDPTLVAHWALDETEGPVAHDSAGDNDGMIIGSPVWHPDAGTIDGALELDGTAFVAADFVLNPSDGPLSVLAWVKGGLPGQVIVSQQAGANWLMIDPQDGSLLTELGAGGRFPKNLGSQAVIVDGGWHRVGLVWDGLHRELYVDDVLVAQDTQETLATSTGKQLIGCGGNSSPGTFFAGLIDEVRIYNRAVKP
jgi:Tol biopolymer transport system component